MVVAVVAAGVIILDWIPNDIPVGPAWIPVIGFFAAGASIIQLSKIVNPKKEPWKF